MTTVRKHLEAIRQQHRHLETLRPQIEAHADRFRFHFFLFGLRFHKVLAAKVEEVLRPLEEESGPRKRG